MNKILGLFLVLALLIFQGCKKEERLTIAVGGAPSEVEYLEKLIGEFERRTGIHVVLRRQPTDTDQRRQELVIALKAGERDPDLFLMDVIWVPQFAASGWLEPLDGYVRESGISLSDFFSGVVEGVDRYDGKLIALPLYVDGGLLYYRKDLLERYGYAPPSTWEELVKQSKKVQRAIRKRNPSFYGFVWQGAQYEGLVCNFLEFAASRGGGIVDSLGRLTIDRPENTEALRFMRDLIVRYEVSPPNTYTEMKEEEVRLFFQRGDALFERNWPYAWKLHQADDSPVKGKVGMALLPSFKGGRHVSTLGGWHIGISRFADRKKEAWELLRFLISEEVQKRLLLDLGWNPGRRDVYSDPEVLKEVPQAEVLQSIFERAIPRPVLPFYTRISEILQKYLNSALSGDMEPDEALKKAQKEAESVFSLYEKK